MKHIKLFEQFILKEEAPKLSAKDIFIPRRLKERWDDLLIPYLNKGYTKDQIYVSKDFNEFISINNTNVKEFKDIKVIIGGVRINGDILKELNLEEVSGEFNCSFNGLTSLKGSPTISNGDFSCFHNKLTSLEGGPTISNGDFSCSTNDITSLVGAPTIVNGDFKCSYNIITSIEGAPKIVKGDFMIIDNVKKFTEEEIRGIVDIKGEVYF